MADVTADELDAEADVTIFDEIDVNDMLITLTAKMKYRFSLSDLSWSFYNQRFFPRTLFPLNEKVIDFSL